MGRPLGTLSQSRTIEWHSWDTILGFDNVENLLPKTKIVVWIAKVITLNKYTIFYKRKNGDCVFGEGLL